MRPPASPGASLTAIDGCLARGSGDDRDGDRFPAVVTRGGAAATPEVTVATTGTGVVIKHDLAHACCLKGAVTAKVEGSAVEVTETLSGEACRCRCRSSLQTGVGLAPGVYALRVRLVDAAGATREVHTSDVEVKRLRAR